MSHLKGDFVTMVGWQPQHNFFIHHDAWPRLPSYLNFQDTQRYHNHPGLLITELLKGAAREAKLLPIRRNLPQPPTETPSAEQLEISVLSQYLAAGARCAGWALPSLMTKRSLDPCVSPNVWRLELGQDGMASKLVVAPWFQISPLILAKSVSVKAHFNFRPWRSLSLEGALRSLTSHRALPL